MIAQTLLLVAVLVGQVVDATGAPLALPQASPSTNPTTLGSAPVSANGVVPPQPQQSPVLSALTAHADADLLPLPPVDLGVTSSSINGAPSSNLSNKRLPTLSKMLGLTPRDPPLSEYYDPFSSQFAYGNAGVQPYKYGWWSYDDVTWMPTEPARGATGSFQNLEWNSYFRYARPINDNLIFSWSPTWNALWWSGPKGVPVPGEVDQITSDIQLASASSGPWNFQLGFTPQMNSDFRRQIDSNAFMFDGRAVLFYQTSPNWRWALGFAYWNRVIDQFIPYGGVVWAPNDRWEFRLFFPKTRISRYCGNYFGGPVWAYGTAEYVVQAWQIDMQNASGVKTRGEMRDYRLMLGAEYQRNQFMAFAECGAVLDRQFYFRDASFNFGVNPGLVARVGLAF